MRTGSDSVVMPSRAVRRVTWVSTGKPGRSSATLRTTFAVFRPTPASAVRSSIDPGTSPPWTSTRRDAIANRLRAFDRKNPVACTSVSSSVGSAAARSSAVGYRAKSAGVTRFTFASVDCADRIVATSNSNALRWSSSQTASG